MPLPVVQLTESRLSSFLSQVDFADCGCWLWTGYRTRHGYGGFGRDRAYTVAYTWFVGKFETGMSLDHLCRTPACVNPDHLEMVTPAENSRRAIYSRMAEQEIRSGWMDAKLPHSLAVELSRRGWF